MIKDTREGKLVTVPAPEAVLESSVANVSFLAGMLVDKFCLHLPLYRQHQRLAQAGIMLSRATLTHLIERAIGLLKPVHDAQLRHILQSRVLAMDETPIRAGPSKKAKGKMHSGWYWPVYGQDDEISFIYSPSRGTDVVKNALGEHFEGMLVTDGYAATASTLSSGTRSRRPAAGRTPAGSSSGPVRLSRRPSPRPWSALASSIRSSARSRKNSSMAKPRCSGARKDQRRLLKRSGRGATSRSGKISACPRQRQSAAFRKAF